ncbi:MAG: hypothetical protein AAB844_00805 [Patescibacteria group bacterium]
MPKGLTTTIEEAAARVRESVIVAVVLPDVPRPDSIGSAHALANGLRKLAKTVSVFAPQPPTGGSARHLSVLGTFGDSYDEPLREFVVSFDLSRSPIKEFKYERDGNKLSILLSPSGARIRREDVEFRYGSLRYDLVITIGVPGLEAATTSIARAPELLHEKPILNLDANPANTNFGELNLVVTESEGGGRMTIPELTYQLLAALDGLPDSREDATALLAALNAATRGFQSPEVSAQAFIMAGDLMRRGGDMAAAQRWRATVEGLAEKHLAARALARSRLDSMDSLWAILTRDDFEKTGLSQESLPTVLQKLRLEFPQADRTLLLWQDPQGEPVRALIALGEVEAGRPSVRDMLLARGEHFELEEVFRSFPEAETRIAQLLYPTDAVE